MQNIKSTAVGVFLGLLGFAGLCALSFGIYGIVTASSPNDDAEAKIKNTGASGEYMPQVTRDGVRAIGKLEAENKMRISMILTGVGVIGLLPIAFVALRKRS